MQQNKKCSSNRTDDDTPGCVAAANVFGTTELLEAILVRLDFKTLLISIQCVSRRFRDVVAGSLQLQKKLFFVSLNGFEEDKTLHMVDDESLVTYPSYDYGEQHRPIGVLNERLVHCDFSQQTDNSSLPVHSYTLADRILPYTISARRGKGSWERMLFLSPRHSLYGFRVVLGAKAERNLPSWRLEDGEMVPTGFSYDCERVDERDLERLRAMMDVAEEEALDEYARNVDWEASRIDPWNGTMRYGNYKRAVRKEQQEEAALRIEASEGVDDSGTSDDEASDASQNMNEDEE